MYGPVMRALTSLFLLLCACSRPSSAPVPVSLEGEPTWYGTVGTLVKTRCSLCHRPGEIGPFPLETWEQVTAVLSSVRDAVETRRMPPFPPEQSPESG